MNLLASILAVTFLIACTSEQKRSTQDTVKLIKHTPFVGETRTIQEIDNLAKFLDSQSSADTLRLRYFADTAGYIYGIGKPLMIEFPDKAARVTAYQEIYFSASVWRDAVTGSLVVYFFNESPSGDWGHTVTMYYRPGGIIAKLDANLRTFYGRVSVERAKYFDSEGTLLKQTKTFRELESNKLIKKPNMDFIDEPLQCYMKVSELPFYKMLR